MAHTLATPRAEDVSDRSWLRLHSGLWPISFGRLGSALRRLGRSRQSVYPLAVVFGAASADLLAGLVAAKATADRFEGRASGRNNQSGNFCGHGKSRTAHLAQTPHCLFRGCLRGRVHSAVSLVEVDGKDD